MHVVVPMVSGSCCNMLEDSSRSSKASQPETSASSVSMRFLARSKYRSWRSFPIDWWAKQRGETGRKEGRIKLWDKGGDHVTCSALSILSPPVWTAESCYPATAPSGCESAPTPPANWWHTRKRTIECRVNTWFIHVQRAQVFSCNNNKQSNNRCGGRVGGPWPYLPPLSVFLAASSQPTGVRPISCLTLCQHHSYCPHVPPWVQLDGKQLRFVRNKWSVSSFIQVSTVLRCIDSQNENTWMTLMN